MVTQQHNEQEAAVKEHIRNKLALLPDRPGCYLMKNKDDVIIYVGKAKILKNRVRSYFTGSHNAKTQKLVSEIVDFEFIITDSNMEALILECNLIKLHNPRYNVLLKDDKTFPYIKITNEKHPKLEITRRVTKDKAKYFGPYPNAYAATQTKKLLDRLYPLRKCGKLPDKVCLYYHIGQCIAPCEYPVEPSQYEQMIHEITRFLNGGEDSVRQELQRKMEEAAEKLEFEKATEYRDQIVAIDTIMQKQKITLNDAMDRDIFGYAVDKGWMSVQILYMRKGKLIERHGTAFPYYGEEYDDFISFVTQYYSDNPALPRQILLPIPSTDSSMSSDEITTWLHEWLKVKIVIPQRGQKSEIVAMAMQNAQNVLDEKFKLIEREQERSVVAAEQLGAAIGLEHLHRVEAFDNSNIQGSNPVSAMVVFTDGKPNRSEYRKYKVKGIEGPDDYGTMREVIRRRYERVLKEGLQLPDLIIVDGGKGQISAATEILQDELNLFIPVCGLVKDDKHRTAELMGGDPPQIIPLKRDSQEFYLLQRIQDEVHRFAITFHRQQRAKSMVESKLDSIPGVGEKRRNQLLKHFGSLKKIKEAQVEDFKPLSIGEKLASTILAALQEDTEEQ